MTARRIKVFYQQSQDRTGYDKNVEGYITQPIKPEISKVVDPLKSKVPLSKYWIKFPSASPSALAEVRIPISDNN